MWLLYVPSTQLGISHCLGQFEELMLKGVFLHEILVKLKTLLLSHSNLVQCNRKDEHFCDLYITAFMIASPCDLIQNNRCLKCPYLLTSSWTKSRTSHVCCLTSAPSSANINVQLLCLSNLTLIQGLFKCIIILTLLCSIYNS